MVNGMMTPDGNEHTVASSLPQEVLDNISPEELEEFVANTNLVGFVEERYQEAASARSTTEDKWLRAFNAFRGNYSAEEEERIKKQEARTGSASRVFIKITKTKVNAAHGQIIEVLYSGNKFPIGIEPTPLPEGVAEIAHFTDSEIDSSKNTEVEVYGFAGDGKELEPGSTHQSLLSGAWKKWKDISAVKGLKEGPALDKNAEIQVHPAQESAEELEKQVHDQLQESNAELALRKTSLEMVILGTGVIKGPFNVFETVDRYEQDPETNEITYLPFNKLTPKLDHVSCWNFYPDPDAATLDDAEYVIEKHHLSRSKLRAMANRPGFKKDAILRVLESAPVEGNKEEWESTLKDSSTINNKNRYEVLEYWGTLDLAMAEQAGLNIENLKDNILDVVQVCIVVCQGELLKVVINPFVPFRIPYYAVPYEELLYQIWGVGVPENMNDTQDLMNGHMRMAIDNLRLSGNVMLEVNENQLTPGQEMTVYPGKIWRKQGGAPGQSIYGITTPNTSQSHFMMFDKARVLADESTGIPSFSHGSTGISSTGKTAAGMSMLMSASQLNIKTVVKNMDHYLLRPLGQAYFQWNMQFNEDNTKIRGDYKVVARGTSSLMMREVLTQRLLTFSQIAMSNPVMAPLVNGKYILEELGKSMDLDPDKLINDMQTAAVMAQLMQQQQGGPNVQQGQGTTNGGTNQQGSSGGIAGVVGPDGQPDNTGTGGGNIGVGGVPQPGEENFSA